MSNRIVPSLLWFAAAWFGYEIVWSLTGVPRGLGPVIATAVASFVAVDPMTLFWPRPARISKSVKVGERSRLVA